MNGENRLLVTDKPVEIEKKTCGNCKTSGKWLIVLEEFREYTNIPHNNKETSKDVARQPSWTWKH